MIWLCRCGHPKTRHTGSSGEYGNYHHGECRVGAKQYGYESYGGCRCYEYKRNLKQTFSVLYEHKWGLIFWALTFVTPLTFLGIGLLGGQFWWGLLGGLGASLILGTWLIKPYLTKEQSHEQQDQT
jgi:hypothetical protein